MVQWLITLNCQKTLSNQRGVCYHYLGNGGEFVVVIVDIIVEVFNSAGMCTITCAIK